MPSSNAPVDRLYQLPLDAFTRERNALASAAKASDPALAARVKALVKPSVPAWAVNQLYWRVRPDYDALVAAADRVRAAQRRLLTGAKATDFQDASDARQQAIVRALRTIDGLCARAGVALSGNVRQRVATTLEAIATYGSGDGAPAAGRLVDDVAPPGFDALAALAAGTTTVPPRSSRRSPEKRRAAEGTAPAREAARRREQDARAEQRRAALAQAESEERAAKEAAARAATAAREASRAADRAREDVDTAKGGLAAAMARATRALSAVKDTRRQAERAEDTVKRAERATRAARRNV